MVDTVAPKTTVAETGNKRKFISQEDLAQCIKDIASWLQTNAPAHYSSRMEPRQNADSNEINAVIDQFGAQNTFLAFSLSKFNGGMHYLDTFVGLPADEIMGVGTKLDLKARKMVPFATDSDDSSFLCISMQEDGSETVVQLDAEDGSVIEDTKLSYGHYLEDLRLKLLTSKLIYEDGLGLVSIA